MPRSTGLRKVLVIEDNFIVMYLVIREAIAQDRVELVWAQTLEEAEDAYNFYSHRLAAIVFDGHVPDKNHTTVALAQRVKESGFEGPMICSSAHQLVSEELRAAGCQFTCSKYEILSCPLALIL